MSKFNAIPDFSPTPESMATTLRAMKDIIEQLISARQGQATAALVFVQAFAPTAVQNPQYGSLWINPETDELKWWSGAEWKALV